MKSYLDLGEMTIIPGVINERQKKDTKWMLTVYPYGLDDRVGEEYMAEKIIE